jgi:arabinofuranosyltransferase
VIVASVATSLPEPSRRGEWLRAGCSSAAFLTRPDAILLIGPLWLALTWQRRAFWRWSLLGLAPIAAWELFSIVYYGAWVPNTAIAKLNIAIPASRLALEGLHYLADSLSDDPITLVVTGLAVVYAAIRGELRARLLALGAVLYLMYVVRIGGDFMSGRFLGAPLLVSLCALNLSAVQPTSPMNAPWARTGSSVVTLAYVLLWPHSPLRSTLDYGRGYHFQPIADERAIYYPASGLLPVLEQYPELKAQKLPIPWTSTAEEGRAFARSKQHITVRADVGFVGFLAGEKLVIVTPGLADPLLARIEFTPAEHFRVGHYIRSLPDGYLESRAFDTNLIARPDLHEAYDAIMRVVRGPLFSAERWKAIWRLNTGYFESAFESAGP